MLHNLRERGNMSLKVFSPSDSVKVQTKPKSVENPIIIKQEQNNSANFSNYEALRSNFIGQTLAFKGKEVKNQFRTIVSDLIGQTGKNSVIRTEKDPILNLESYIIQRENEKDNVTITVRTYPNAAPIIVIKANETKDIPIFDLVLFSKSPPLIQLRDNKNISTILAYNGSQIKGKNFDVTVGEKPSHLSFKGTYLIKGLRPEESDLAVKEYFDNDLFKNVEKGDYADNLKQQYSLVALVGGYGTRLAPIAEVGKHNKPSVYLPGLQYRLMHTSVLDMGVRAGIIDPYKLKTDIKEKNIINYDPDKHKIDKNIDTNLVLINGPEDKVLNIGYSLSSAIIDGIIPVNKPAIFTTSDFLSNIDLSRALKEFEETNSGYMAINNTIPLKEISNQTLMSVKQDKKGQWLIDKFYDVAKNNEELDNLAKNTVIDSGKYKDRYVTSSNCQVVIIHPKVLQAMKNMFKYNEEESLITFFNTVHKLLNGKEKILNKEGKPIASLVEMGITDKNGNPGGIMGDNGEPLKMTFSFAEAKDGHEAIFRDVGTVDSFIKEARKIAKNENNEYNGFPKPLLDSFKELVDPYTGIVYMSKQAKLDYNNNFKQKYSISEMQGNIMVMNTFELPELVNLQKRWHKLTDKLGISDQASTEKMQQLFENYSKTSKTPYIDGLSREFHSTDHIIDCLEKFDAYMADKNTIKPKYPEILELAIFFHDFYYGRSYDVEDSAKEAGKFLREYGNSEFATPKNINLLEKHILATKHSESPDPADLIDTKLMLDIDLSILGESPEKYGEYCKKIRQEYSKYDDDEFNTGRKENVLKPFINRNPLFKTEWFRERYENQARINMKNEIKLLEKNNKGK